MAVDKPTQPVTLEVLASEVADTQAQLAIVVEWVQALDSRLSDTTK